jgi:hypothetical protein
LENKNIGEKELHQGLGHFCLERYTLKDFHPKEFSQARKFNIKKNVFEIYLHRCLQSIANEIAQ